MTFKVLAPAALLPLLSALLLTPSGAGPCAADAVDAGAVGIRRFTVGVTPTAPRRYQVKDIRVGGVSVLSLFTKKLLEDRARRSPANSSWYPEGYFKPENIQLHIDTGLLDEFKRVLIAHPGEPLEVLLRDEWNPFWTRLLRRGCDDPYEYSIRIRVEFEQTRCDEVTRLVYDKIVSPLLKEGREESRTTREADRRLDLNEMFDKLTTDGEIEAYLNKLGPATDNPCVQTIRLLKKLKEEKADRFGLGEYELSPEIRGGLKLMRDAMTIDPDWWRSSLSLRVTGYTDEVEVDKVKGKELLMSKTGIDSDVWSKVEHPLEVFYGGCSEDTVRDEQVYARLVSPEGGQMVGDRIYNNCQLGAVRAYVALVYMTNELHRVGPEDSYATGGVFSGPDVKSKSKNNPEKRRVNVEFTLKAARAEGGKP
jgi:hypothetical protein